MKNLLAAKGEVQSMKKIAVIGSINMDLTARADRLPGKGETVSAVDLQYVPGGKGANQAVAAARLGGDVAMFGCVGDDAFADRLIDNLKQNGVDTTYIRRAAGVSSGIAMITVAEGDNCIVVASGANHCVTPAYLDEVKPAVLSADILVLQNEIPPDTVAYAMELGRQAGKLVLYNPAPAALVPEDILEKADYITPNEHETALLFPDAEELPALLERCGGKLIVTLGEKGAAAWADGAMLQIPARPAEVRDTTGAGDTFNGAFACALAKGYSLEKALRLANVAASLSTEQAGAQGGMPTWKRVMECAGFKEP